VSRRCFANSPSEVIPSTVEELCGETSVNSVTLCRLLPYDLHAAPSKENSETLEKGTNVCLALARDDAETSD
jgi:hypothetical protein